MSCDCRDGIRVAKDNSWGRHGPLSEDLLSRPKHQSLIHNTHVSLCLSPSVSVFVSVSLCVSLYVCLCLCVSLFASVCPTVCLSLCLSVCLSVFLSVSLSVSLFVSISVSHIYYIFQRMTYISVSFSSPALVVGQSN